MTIYKSLGVMRMTCERIYNNLFCGFASLLFIVILSISYARSLLAHFLKTSSLYSLVVRSRSSAQADAAKASVKFSIIAD